MMNSSMNSLLVAVMMLNLVALASSRLRSLIRIVAVQGILLGFIPPLIHAQLGVGGWFICIASISLKGLIIPQMLEHALLETQIKREVEPMIGYLPSIFLGAAATAIAMAFAGNLPLNPEHKTLLIVPAALSTVLVGFILLTTRYKAITQVIGYLILENGIFIFGMLLLEAMPMLVEIGVLLDLFVGIFVISIIVNHITSAFSSLDTRHLSALKE